MIPFDLKEEKMIVASNLYRVTNKSEFNNEFIYQILRSSDYREHIRLNAKGTTVGMITKDAIENYELKLPKKKELFEFQSKLVPLVEMIMLKMIERKKLIKLQSLLLSKMTKS